MLWNAKTLFSFSLQSVEGELREITQFYFDDQTWNVLYVVADASSDLFSYRKVLVSAQTLRGVDGSEGRLHTNLTRIQIEKCPTLKSHLPVSRQSEPAFHDYFDPKTGDQSKAGFFPYVVGPDLEPDRGKPRPVDLAEDAWDLDLRSIHALNGYHIGSTDGDIGYVNDFIIDESTWTIRYLVLDSHHWLPGRRTLVSTQWVKSIDAEHSEVVVTISPEAVKESQAYDEHVPITREYEIALYRHYDRKGYWLDRSDDTKAREMPRTVPAVELNSSR